MVLMGFSQGCGMSLHAFYELPKIIDYVIGISGYLFPFSKYTSSYNRLKIIYGDSDRLRPW